MRQGEEDRVERRGTWPLGKRPTERYSTRSFNSSIYGHNLIIKKKKRKEKGGKGEGSERESIKSKRGKRGKVMGPMKVRFRYLAGILRMTSFSLS